MKSKTQIIAFATLVAIFIITGCAGPEARHDDRTGRRDDRQDNRVDRRDARW
jgi:hypothetical protein